MTQQATTDFTRVFDLVAYQQKKYPQQKALNYFIGARQADGQGEWRGYTTAEIQEKANQVSCWLIEQDFQSGDCVAIIPKMGSPLWMIIDFGCQQIGMVTVPIHPTSSAEDIKFIFDETKVKLCIAADVVLYNKVKVVFTGSNIFHLDDSEEGFFSALNHKDVTIHPELLNRKNAVTETDTLSIMYTSGTSGTPKGAVLTHYNVVSNIKSILPLFPIRPGDRILSFLPFSHIFERTSCYVYFAFGASIFFAEKLERLSYDFKTVRPYLITCVPKTLERMYEFLEEQRQQKSKIKRWLVKWAMQIGEQSSNDKEPGMLFGIKLLMARVFVLNTWRKALSSKIRYIIVGAAALRPEIARLFSAAGVMTLSGYGMTEASPFIAVNRPDIKKFGTVGLPVPGVEIKLDEINETGEGEILVKGPNIMTGYFNRPELNQEVFTTDGWFKTGDLGTFINHRYLSITGRKKDIFKTSSGIYIVPQELELHLTSSEFISQAMVFGFNKPFVSAILVPHYVLLKNWCDEQNIHWTSPTYMVHNIKVIQKYDQEIERLNESLPNYKKILKYILSDAEWTPETGELTASLKMIRGKLMEKYTTEIEKLYT